MRTSVPDIASPPTRFGLTARLGLIVAVLAGETLLASYFIQANFPSSLSHGAELVHTVQHWLFRFIIAYGISLAMLAYLRAPVFAAAAAAADHAPVRPLWACVHVTLVVPFVYFSSRIYAGSAAGVSPGTDFAALAIAWHACALAAVLALFAALAPFEVWRRVLHQTQGLPFFAVLPAAAAVAAIKASQLLWGPAAQITFRVVRILLQPLLPDLRSDPGSLVLGTPRFAVQIAEICSGLEGIGLLLAFSAGWLWLFRRDYYFPRALLIVPVGVIVIFLLNAVRIAAIVLIGNAGYERVALLGFHSQAGWIAFNLTAFGIAVLAHNTPWVSRVAPRTRSGSSAAAASEAAATAGGPVPAANPTAAYLMPLLAILAAGMVSHALSAGFEFLYPLRFLAAVAVLWMFRQSYVSANLGFSWRGPAVGTAVFCLWLGAAAVLMPPQGAPDAAGGPGDAARAAADPVDRVPGARRGGHCAAGGGARLSGLSDAKAGQPTVRDGTLLCGPVAGARGERAGVRPDARGSMAARHRCRSRLRRARGAHRQARRVHCGAWHHQCAACRLCADSRPVAALVIETIRRMTHR